MCKWHRYSDVGGVLRNFWRICLCKSRDPHVPYKITLYWKLTIEQQAKCLQGACANDNDVSTQMGVTNSWQKEAKIHDLTGEGVKNPENLADVICTWPLTLFLLYSFRKTLYPTAFFSSIMSFIWISYVRQRPLPKMRQSLPKFYDNPEK